MAVWTNWQSRYPQRVVWSNYPVVGSIPTIATNAEVSKLVKLAGLDPVANIETLVGSIPTFCTKIIIMLQPKLLFNDRSLPLILEALGHKTDEDGFIIDKGEKIHVDKIVGFHKELGVITNWWDIVNYG